VDPVAVASVVVAAAVLAAVASGVAEVVSVVVVAVASVVVAAASVVAAAMAMATVRQPHPARPAANKLEPVNLVGGHPCRYSQELEHNRSDAGLLVVAQLCQRGALVPRGAAVVVAAVAAVVVRVGGSPSGGRQTLYSTGQPSTAAAP
jgi:hypothetical protein